jgi:hypothetical protein
VLQVHKVQHKPIKDSNYGLNLKRSKELECAMDWRTGLSGVPPGSVRCTRTVQVSTSHSGKMKARSAIIHRIVRCTTGLSGEPAKQWLSAPTVDSDNRNSAAQYRAEVRAAESDGNRTVQCDTGLSGAARGQSLQRSTSFEP